MNTYFIILAGGSGTRLWPLSTKERPKHLLPFLNNKSLLDQTIERIKPLTKEENIGIITAQEQVNLIKKYSQKSVGFILAEPTARNTAPAILYSCLKVFKKDKNATLVFLPADHFIPETQAFNEYIQSAISYTQSDNRIVTLGLMPTYPATGYGYIQAHTTKTLKAKTIYSVERFHEKPSKQKAEEYIAQNNMLWNLGMFVGKVAVFINEFKKLAPEIYSSVLEYVEKGTGYESATATSIDYAIMEKSKNISIMPCNFEWSDVGNLNTFLSLQQKHGKNPNNNLNINASGNISHASKPVVFIGVDNICLVEDNNVIVVSSKDEIERVKEAKEKFTFDG